MGVPQGLQDAVAKAIKGMSYKTNAPVEEEGKPTRYVPRERPMVLGDVLDAKQTKSGLVIVTGDGRKHRLAAEPATGNQEKDKDKDKK